MTNEEARSIHSCCSLDGGVVAAGTVGCSSGAALGFYWHRLVLAGCFDTRQRGDNRHNSADLSVHEEAERNDHRHVVSGGGSPAAVAAAVLEPSG